jgi:hypothetical protein
VTEKRLPTEEERAELRALAAEVSKGDQSVDEKRQRQRELWESLISKGVIKSAIARESGISHPALNQRLATTARGKQ